MIRRCVVVAALILAGCADVVDEPVSIDLYHFEDDLRQSAAGEVTCAGTAPTCPARVGEPGYEVVGIPGLDGDDVLRDSARADRRGTGEPIVSATLNADGTRKFEELTRKIAEQGRRRNEVQHLAILVDDELVAWTEIDYRLYPNGLDGSAGIQIPVKSQADAEGLADDLRGG
jgi:preprotein translocase subunit SecD